MSLVPKKIFFDDFFDDFMPTTKTMDMKCDIYEEGKNYIIELDAPGFDKKDIALIRLAIEF